MSTRFPFSPTPQRPIPAVILELADPAGRVVISAVSAHLDTGALMTIVPLPLIQRLGVVPVNHLLAKGFGSAPARLDVYQIRLTIPGVGGFDIDVIGHAAEPYVLVGRDILNLFRITYDGPNQVTEFH